MTRIDRLILLIFLPLFSWQIFVVSPFFVSLCFTYFFYSLLFRFRFTLFHFLIHFIPFFICFSLLLILFNFTLFHFLIHFISLFFRFRSLLILFYFTLFHFFIDNWDSRLLLSFRDLSLVVVVVLDLRFTPRVLVLHFLIRPFYNWCLVDLVCSLILDWPHGFSLTPSNFAFPLFPLLSLACPFPC